MKTDIQGTVSLLLDWFHQSGRELPWRKDTDPYHVWVSEIMLQQTRIETVLPYYARFMKALPDIEALSQCPQEKLLKLWEGKRMEESSRNVMNRSVPFPESGIIQPVQSHPLPSVRQCRRWTAMYCVY